MGTDGYSTEQGGRAPLPLNRTLHLDLQPATRLTWIGAGWAALCGVVATGSLQFSEATVVRALLTFVLADPVLGAVWNNLLKLGHLSQASWVGSASVPAGSARDGKVSLEPRALKSLSSGDTQTVEAGPTVENLELEPASAEAGALIDGDSTGRQSETVDGVAIDVDEAPSGTPKMDGRPTAGVTVTRRRPLLEIGLLSGLALLLALILGRAVAIVVGVGLLLPLLVWFAAGEHPLRGKWTRAVLEIGLSWTVGVAAFSTLPASSIDGVSGAMLSAIRWAGEQGVILGIGVLFVVSYAGNLALEQSRRAFGYRLVVNVPQVVAVLLLVGWRRPILAGTAAILVFAQMLFQPYLRRQRIRSYLRSTQWLFMGVMLLTAIGVALSHS